MAAQGGAHAALARPHKAHQDYGPYPGDGRRLRGVRRPTRSSAHLWRQSAARSRPRSPSLSLVFNGPSSTLLEVDFTTEGKQPDRRCCLVHRTCEGTPCPHYERCVFGFQKKVVFHFAPDRPRRHINRGIVGSAGLDISAVTGEHIFAATAEIALITDFSAGRIDLHQQTTHRVQYHVAADGRDFHMSVADI